MAEPLAFLLPFDGFHYSTSSRWHAFDNNTTNNNAGDSPRLNNDHHSSCGVAAKMAFTQFLNCDSLRTPQAECRSPQEVTLAAESPSEAAVTTVGYCSAADEIFSDKPSTSAVVEEKTFNNDALLVGARPAGNEVASTSYEPVEVSQ